MKNKEEQEIHEEQFIRATIRVLWDGASQLFVVHRGGFLVPPTQWQAILPSTHLLDGFLRYSACGLMYCIYWHLLYFCFLSLSVLFCMRVDTHQQEVTVQQMQLTTTTNH
jgi:hypothetical protein